jgi:hypothetical protein
MTNTFKAYAIVQDKDLFQYVEDLETQYKDDRLDMNTDKLMKLGTPIGS